MSVVFPSLTELFPDGNYEFRLTLRRAEPREFFRAHDSTGNVLRERARWLAAEPAHYAALRPEGESLLAEFRQLAESWGLGPPASAGAGESGQLAKPGGVRGTENDMVALGRAFEPDILFLSPDAAGEFRLRGGALCFPTGWALEEKLGHTLEFIHGVVPGLNVALGAQIHQFLSKLKPGVAFLRHNWGLAATDELNLHPARRVPAPEPPVRLDQLWLRVEHQALVALAETRGIAFGIRIASHRLDRVAGGAASAGLRRALETMPAELAAYKRLEAVRADVIRLL